MVNPHSEDDGRQLSQHIRTDQVKQDSIRPVGFFFGNTELSLELWTVIAGISGFDD